MTQHTDSPSSKQLPLWANVLVVLLVVLGMGVASWRYLKGADKAEAVALKTAPVSPRQAKMNELWQLIEKGDLAGVRRAVEADGWLATVRNPAVSNATPLHSAGWHGKADVAAFLLDKGADPNIVEDEFHGTPLSWSVVAGQKETVALLVARGGRNTPDLLGIAEAGKRGEFKQFAPNPPSAYDAVIALLKAKPAE